MTSPSSNLASTRKGACTACPTVMVSGSPGASWAGYGKPCPPSLQTTLPHPGNWATAPGWQSDHKATWPAGSEVALGNSGYAPSTARWSVSPVPIAVFVAWPSTPGISTQSLPRRSARQPSLPLTGQATKYGFWQAAPSYCQPIASASRNPSSTTVAARFPMVSFTRQPAPKGLPRWWCSSMVGQPQPAIRCWTHGFSTGPSVASPLPT
ncbi:hypothetical protein D3C79_705010 [compost metagenome]